MRTSFVTTIASSSLLCCSSSALRLYRHNAIYAKFAFFRTLSARRICLDMTKEISSSPSVNWTSRQKCWRPTVTDVERISWGKPAKRKGTGSRGVPHRLNHDDERRQFDQARRKGFLEVTGSGWRATRRGSPLVNSYRSLCDARSQVCMILHKGNQGIDEVVVDFSPLRLPETFQGLEDETKLFVGLSRKAVDGMSNNES